MFSVSLAVPQVDAQQQVCCELTKSGEFCSYTTQEQCDPKYASAPTNCERTSLCKLGCGYDTDAGRCFKNTPRAACDGKEDCVWDASESCEIPQCELGCCTVGDQAVYTTKANCRNIVSEFPGVPMIFDETIESEFSCINSVRSQEKGACVSSDGSCDFTTRESCIESAETLTENATIANPNVGFHSGFLCSNPKLGTNCAPQQYTGCLDDKDEVYWFDSCGNAENIYSADKRGSYNNGLILSKEQSCKINGANDKNCGSCDFTTGTLCSNYEGRENKPAFGDFTCIDLSCENIEVDETIPNSFSRKKLGESWCAYDALVGFGQDAVGSRHFKKLCINGQELTEECKDFREEICVQGVRGEPPLSNEETVRLNAGDEQYVEAACRSNRWQGCNDIKGNFGDAESFAKAKDNCENINVRDCTWIGDKNAGRCIPFVPPGLKFWPGEGKNAVPSADATQQCNLASNECNVVYEKGGFDSSWTCIQNCECLNKDYLLSMNDVCKSYGDCGAYVNYLGAATLGGFDENHKEKILIGDVEGYNDVIFPNEKNRGQYQSKMKAFFSKAAPSLLFSGAIGVYSLATVGNFLPGFGFNIVTPGIKSVGSSLSFQQELLTSKAQAGLVKDGTLLMKEFNTASQNLITAGNNLKLAASKLGGTVEASTGTITFPAGSVGAGGAGKAGFTYAVDGGATAIGGGPAPISIPSSTTDAVRSAGETFGTAQKSLNAAEASVKANISPFGTVLQVLNTIAWIYTIVSLLDVLLSDTKEEKITVTCEPWVAPRGGDNCEECGEDGKPCSEYRCRSLGQLCKLVNSGTSEEACINTNPNDVSSPIITPDVSVLPREQTIKEVKGQGYKLNQKIKPFTPVTLGIKTNEPAQCKYGLQPGKSFEEQAGFFGSNLYVEDHNITFSLPSELAEEQILRLTNNGDYSVYVRCEDANGNANNRDYYIQFAILPGPDKTPPNIEVTNIESGSFIGAGINETTLIAYLNEPAQCKWSKQNIDYNLMTDLFACQTSSFPQSSVYHGLYACATTLTDIKVNQLNNYFIRCQDQPKKAEELRNTNIESYRFSLQGTVPLEMTSLEPSGEFFNGTLTLTAKTAKGAQNGKAICGYAYEDNVNSVIDFFNTGNVTVHTQPFNLDNGDYTFYVYCIDSGGNIASKSTSVNVRVDDVAPQLRHVYTTGNLLKVETSEETTCEYSTEGSFTFGQGNKMTGEGVKLHEVVLDSSVYNIICNDLYGNKASFKIYK
jgi:hypothetical protein